jgi:prepilin-type N-terminal cleavage/methylation domain-containing protein
MKKFFKNYGFTLFELLAVLAILAIIAGIAVPRVMQTIKNARIQALQSEMQLVANSVQRLLMEEEIMGSEVGVPFYMAGANITGITDTINALTDYNGDNVAKYVYDATESGFYNETGGIFDNYTTGLDLNDYLEAGIPDYLLVLIADRSKIDGETEADTLNEAAILVIYDEDSAPFSNVKAAELNFDPVSFVNGTPSGVGQDGNIAVRFVQFSGVDITD